MVFIDFSHHNGAYLHCNLCMMYCCSRDPPTLCPSDTSHGYKQPKAKIGRSIVRHWKRMPFTNPARSDGLVLLHWRRAAEEGKEYPFAQFNKVLNFTFYDL